MMLKAGGEVIPVVREKKRVGKAVGLGTCRVCLGSRPKLALPAASSRVVGRESMEEEARVWPV